MSRIDDVNNLLVVTNPNISAVEYLCLVTLLTSRHSDSTTHIVSRQDGINMLTEKLPLPTSSKVELKEQISPRKFVLTFNKGAGNVKNIQWHQSDNEVNFYISMDDGHFKPDGMQFRPEGADYDAILYFNLANFQSVANVFDPYKHLLNEAQTLPSVNQLR